MTPPTPPPPPELPPELPPAALPPPKKPNFALDVFLGMLLYIGIGVGTLLLCGIDANLLGLGLLGLPVAVIWPIVAGRNGIAVGVLCSIALTGLLVGLCFGIVFNFGR